MSKIKKIVIVIFTIITLFVSTSFSAFASTSKVYNLPIGQPSAGSNYGYVELQYDTDLFVIFFHYEQGVNPGASDPQMWVNFKIDPNNYSMSFQPASNSAGEIKIWAFYTSMYVNGSLYSFSNNGQTNTFPYLAYTKPPTGIHLYGCGYTGYKISNSTPFTVSYGNDVIANQKLTDIYNAINSQSGSADKITANADKNAGEIKANNDKNTQNIIDNQNQLAEQEKTETQNSGNDSVNDVSSSVPDKSAGMLSALQSLSNAVSYTGTSAKWKFPQMYIPAITGVTDRINLNPEMDIDFSYWINQIPQDIRTVISSLATIGLVVFAFKELYGLISYVLTLKGGGDNE